MHNLILSSVSPSPFLGIIFLLLFFAGSLFVVIGCKIAHNALKQFFEREEPKTAAPPPDPVKTPRVKRSKTKPIRSIEINPDEVDRIYVKKIS